jgi:branched-chain amino acid transport system permease protein
MPSFEHFKPFIVTGLSLGGVYALSGTGIVVLYRATGVLNLAFGAVGAMGALISWALINHTGCPTGLAYVVCILFAAVVTLAYGAIFGPPLSGRGLPVTRGKPA